MSSLGCGGGGGGGSTAVAQGNNTDGTALNGTNSVTLRWNSPTSNANGSILSDLAGYKIQYGPGTGSQNLTHSVNIGNYTSATVNNLSSGYWCFTVTAYDTSGNESLPSPEACKTI